MSHRFTALSLLVLASGCTDEPEPLDITGEARVATCRTRTFTASPVAAEETVTWSSRGGTISSTGHDTALFEAPLQVPGDGSATVTATLGDRAGQATLEIATAFPEAQQGLGTPHVSIPNTARIMAMRGTRAYAVVQTNVAPFVVSVIRSDDGGATWGAPKEVARHDGPAPLQGTAIAIDAGSDDVVYVSLRVDGGGPGIHTIAQVGNLEAGALNLLATSTDGGTTFTNRAYFAGGNGDMTTPDVASPAPNTVVITAPLPWYDPGTGEQGTGVLAIRDTQRGAMLGTPTPGDNGYDAEWPTAAAQEFRNGNSQDIERSTHGHGIQLATNGAGRVCLTYAQPNGGNRTVNLFARCSSNGGMTWDSEVTVASDSAGAIERPRIAMSADGMGLAVTWNTESSGTPNAGNRIALSTDGGASFSAARLLPDITDDAAGVLTTSWIETQWDAEDVLWLARRVEDSAKTVVDKSCDGGDTWSGALYASDERFDEPMLVTSSDGIFVTGVRPATANDFEPALVKLLDAGD